MQFGHGIPHLKQTEMLVFHATVIGSFSVKAIGMSGRQGFFHRH